MEVTMTTKNQSTEEFSIFLCVFHETLSFGKDNQVHTYFYEFKYSM